MKGPPPELWLIAEILSALCCLLYGISGAWKASTFELVIAVLFAVNMFHCAWRGRCADEDRRPDEEVTDVREAD